MPNPTEYNAIFEKLVLSSDDLIGLLAYSIYKREKVAFVRQYREAHSNAAPPAEELEKFHNTCALHLASYRNEAEVQFQKLSQNLLEENLSRFGQVVQEENKKRRNNFWRGVWQSVVGSVLYTLVIGLIFIFILGIRYGIGGLINEGTQMLTPQAEIYQAPSGETMPKGEAAQ